MAVMAVMTVSKDKEATIIKAMRLVAGTLPRTKPSRNQLYLLEHVMARRPFDRWSTPWRTLRRRPELIWTRRSFKTYPWR
eukprot:5097890-Alexandrium_andersonii.AAC.1